MVSSSISVAAGPERQQVTLMLRAAAIMLPIGVHRRSRRGDVPEEARVRVVAAVLDDHVAQGVEQLWKRWRRLGQRLVERARGGRRRWWDATRRGRPAMS